MELFCIEHGTMEKAQALFDTVKITHPDGVKDEKAIQIGFIHEQRIDTDQGGGIDWCNFGMGWATTPPPSNFPDDDFDDWVEFRDYVSYMDFFFPEPPAEELEIINANAEILLYDLGVK